MGEPLNGRDLVSGTQVACAVRDAALQACAWMSLAPADDGRGCGRMRQRATSTLGGDTVASRAGGAISGSSKSEVRP